MTASPESIIATIALLAETFPKCFAIFERRRRPLKIGIHLDILAATAGAITPQELGAALRFYVGNLFYLRACVVGTPRIDLNGEQAGTVTEDEAKNARATIEARARKRAARSAASPPTKANGTARPGTPQAPKMPSVAPPSTGPQRLGLADLKRAWIARVGERQ